jgi:hypothetical protein
MKLVNLFLVVLAIIGCKKADPSSAPKKEEGVTEQPTEVSGGFGLTMQCTVTNRDVPNSTSSEIACVVSNDDGTKFTGSYKDLKASVTARNASDKIQITPSQATNDSPVSLIVSVPGVKPDDSLSIQVEGKFDDAPAVLSASLLGPFALTCSRDVNYWVESGAPDPTNLTCSEQKPCRSIGQAVALIPDIINCNLTINVKAGTYEESLTIASREIRPNKTIRIKGVDGTPIIKAPDNLPIATPDSMLASYPDKGLRTAVQITSILAKNAYVEFENVEIRGGADLESPVSATDTREAKTMYEVSKDKLEKFETGIYASTSSLKLTNVKLTGFSHVALLVDQSSRLITNSVDRTRPALEINKSRVGLRASDVDRVFFGGDTKIIGNGDIQDGAGVDLARSINVRFLDDATLNIKDLAYGIIAERSLIQPAYATAGIEIENVFTGLHLVNYSEFIWEPKLSETKTSYLKIKKCYFVCIDADNSVLKLISEDVNPAETNKKRLELELDSRLTGDDRYSDREHHGLLRAKNRSTIDFSYLDNAWCNIGNFFNTINSNIAIGISQNIPTSKFAAFSIQGFSQFNFRQFSSSENQIKNDCRDFNRRSILVLKNFANRVDLDGSCPFGTFEEFANQSGIRSCYSDLGQSLIFTKSPPRHPNYPNPEYFTDSGPTEAQKPESAPFATKDPYHERAYIMDDMLTSTTAGGEPLAIFTTGFHNITSAKINGAQVSVLHFDSAPTTEYGTAIQNRQKVTILPPPTLIRLIFEQINKFVLISLVPQLLTPQRQ